MGRVALLLSLLLLLQGPVTRAQTLPPSRDQTLALLSGYLDTLRAQSGIPGMVGAIVSDSTLPLWEQEFGQINTPAGVNRTDTLFHFDGLTQMVTAAMVLQCVDQGRAQLDTPISVYSPNSPDANATIRQILTHTSGTPGNLAFSYNTTRLKALEFVIETCKGTTFRQAFTTTLQQLGMMESVPGPDAASTSLPNADLAPPADQARYVQLLTRLAQPTPSQYSVTTLEAWSGLISNVFDFAKFDIAVRQGGLLGSQLAAAWSNPVNTNGQVLPHGMGWFVQTYNGEPVVWQYGVQPNAGSSLVLTLPNRQITLILLANSDGLAQPSSLSAGDVLVSPFARIFLGLVVK